MKGLLSDLKYLVSFSVLLAGIMFFIQCSDNISQSNVDDADTSVNAEVLPNGNLTLSITDAPFPIELIAEAKVTINKVEVRRAEKDSSDNGKPFTVLNEEVQTFNLLELTNGVTQTLVDVEIDTGSYDLVRLYVSDAFISVADTVAGDTITYDMKVPSGAQTGIKVFVDPAIRVEGGLSSELLLDFNLSKSFVVKGNPNTPAGIKGFNFKPVIRAVNQSNAGRIKGIVATAEDSTIADAEVWVTQDTTIATTFSDSTGFYSLIGLPEGIYDLRAVKADFDTTTISNVTVTSGNISTVNITLNEQQ